MINTKKIKKRMSEKGLSQREIAKALDVAVPTVSQKLNNVRPLHLREAKILSDLLDIQDGEFGSYFFD